MFLLNVSVELGMTVRQLLANTTSADLTDLQAYFAMRGKKQTGEKSVDEKLEEEFGGEG